MSSHGIRNGLHWKFGFACGHPDLSVLRFTHLIHENNGRFMTNLMEMTKRSEDTVHTGKSRIN